MFAIFDGHGGEFAANYAKEFLIQNLFNRVVDIKNIASGMLFSYSSIKMCVVYLFATHSKTGKSPKITLDLCQSNESEKKDAEKPPASPLLTNRNKMKKTLSVAEDASKSTNVTDPELLSKLEALQRPITKEVRPCKPVAKSPMIPSASYLDSTGKIDYGRLLTDEVLAADRLLVEAAKKTVCTF